ncbi:hypothetical protein HDU80_008936 [Chytriomyces hyalinus]|nr:hypothetical protein HDU80_008936 [Chytriomyces hyalinus]
MEQAVPNFFKEPVEFFKLVWSHVITPIGLILTHTLTVPILGNRKFHHTVFSYVSAMCNPIATSTMGIGNLICIFLLFRRISDDLDSILEEQLGRDMKIRVDLTRRPFDWFFKRSFLVQLMPCLYAAKSKQTDLEALNKNAEQRHLVACIRPLFNLVHRWHYACALYDKAIVVKFKFEPSEQTNWEGMWGESRKKSKPAPFPYLFSNQRVDMAQDAFPQSDVGKKYWTFLHWDIAADHPIETYYALASKHGDQFLSSTKGGNKYDIAISCVQAFISSMYAFRNGFPDMNSPDLLLAVFSIHSVINALHHFLYIVTPGHRVLVLESPEEVTTYLLKRCKDHQSAPTKRDSTIFEIRSPWHIIEEMHENIKTPPSLGLKLEKPEVKSEVESEENLLKTIAYSIDANKNKGDGLSAEETKPPRLTVTGLCVRTMLMTVMVQLGLYAALIVINTHRTGGLSRYTKLDMRSDDSDGRAKEEARRQWVRELDEQRKMQRAKVEDEKQRLNTQTSGSFFTGGVSASTNSSSVTGARRRNLSEIHKQSTNHGSTPEHVYISQVQHTSHHVDRPPDAAVPSNQKNRASHADPTPPTHSPPSTHVANFGRMRNQFIDSGLTADADKKKRDADVWREQLQIQIEEKKQRQLLEKKQSEDFVYQSWSEMQRPGSQGGGGGKSGLGGNSNSVTGMPVRRSMHTIQRDEETLNRQSVPGLETDSARRSTRQDNLPPPSPKKGMNNDYHAAPAAESFSSPPQVFSSNLSKIPRAVRKSISIPKPEHNPLDWGEDAEQHDSADNLATHSPLPTRNHPNQPKSQNRNFTNPTINNPSEPRGQQQKTSMSRNQTFDHSTEDLHERMRNISLNASVRTPSPPSSPPLPAQQLHNQNNSSPNRKLSKILGSVKSSLGYPAVVSEQPARAQKRNPSNQPIQSSSTNKPPRVRSAFGRTLPPAPSTQPANTSNIPTRELNRNKKLPSIKSDKSGGRVNKALLQKEMQHRDAVVAKAQQLYQQQQRNHISALHSMTHRAENHDAEIADTFLDNRKPTQKNQQESASKNAMRKEASNRNDFIEKASDDVLVAAGTSTGRGRKGEFTPHGSLRPPWGVSATEEEEYVKQKNIPSSVAKKGGDGGVGKVVRPPWGIEEDVPMRVVGRERRPKASSGAAPAGVDEEVLRMKALNELSRFGSLLAEEKRALSWDMGM